MTSPHLFGHQRDGIDFDLASIQADFKDGEPFDQKYMVALFERGYKPQATATPGVKAPPGMELVTQAHNAQN